MPICKPYKNSYKQSRASDVLRDVFRARFPDQLWRPGFGLIGVFRDQPPIDLESVDRIEECGWGKDMFDTNPVSITHWDRVTHICVGKLTIIVSDNGLSPGRRQAIIWTNAGILLIGTSGINFSEIFIGIRTFSFKKMHLKMLSAKWRPFCLGLNVLKRSGCEKTNPSITVNQRVADLSRECG